MWPARGRARRTGASTAAAATLLAHLALAALVVTAAAAEGGAVHAPVYTIYHRKTELLEKVAALAASNPKTMRSEVRRAADGDYSSEMQIVTVEPAGLGSGKPTDKVRLLLDFGQHAREYISSEVGLRFLQALYNSTDLEAVAGSARRAARLRRILARCLFKVVPMENVNGRDLVEAGQLCERKNGRGVDTNRNWGVDWGVKERDYDPTEEFPGRGPHSEPETQIVLSVAKSLKPHVWLNVHSGMYALFSPYDHKPQVPSGVNAEAALRILSRINEVSCRGKCSVGSGGKSVGYLAHGTATDYMYEVLRVPLSFTWEIYGDNAASHADCFRMFNPVTAPVFEETVASWVAALFQLLELLPTHPATAPLLKATAAENAQDSGGDDSPSHQQQQRQPRKQQQAEGKQPQAGQRQQQQQQQQQQQAEKKERPRQTLKMDSAPGGGGHAMLLLFVGTVALVGLLWGRVIDMRRSYEALGRSSGPSGAPV